MIYCLLGVRLRTEWKRCEWKGTEMLELKNISFAAEGKEILKDVSLEIADRFVAITGPNGSGKSTLLKVIMGLMKPTAGRILLDGQDITDLPVDPGTGTNGSSSTMRVMFSARRGSAPGTIWTGS